MMKSGFSIFRSFLRGIYFVNKITKLKNLDFKKPVIGRNFSKSKFDNFKTFI